MQWILESDDGGNLSVRYLLKNLSFLVFSVKQVTLGHLSVKRMSELPQLLQGLYNHYAALQYADGALLKLDLVNIHQDLHTLGPVQSLKCWYKPSLLFGYCLFLFILFFKFFFTARFLKNSNFYMCLQYKYSYTFLHILISIHTYFLAVYIFIYIPCLPLFVIPYSCS